MKRRLKGKIVSNKMDKTVKILVERVKTHPIYKKKYKVSKNYNAHTEDAKKFIVGEIVFIEETRPISKTKRWVVVDDKAKEDMKKNTKKEKKEGK